MIMCQYATEFGVSFSQFIESSLHLRSLDAHLKQCEELNTSYSFVEVSKEYGINSKSVLTSLRYFDICSGALIPDVMHDVLEGVLQYEMKLLLCCFIFDKAFFSASTFTHLMEVFELGYMEVSNRPTPITKKTLKKKDHSLVQNGM